jgi:hypothetical protein
LAEKMMLFVPAVLILEQMFGFSPPLGAKNQTSAGVSGRRRRPETPADVHTFGAIDCTERLVYC